LPDEAEPLQRLQLVAALAVGTGIIWLRRIASSLGLSLDLDVALDALARGQSAIVTARLTQLDDRLASLPSAGPANSDRQRRCALLRQRANFRRRGSA